MPVFPDALLGTRPSLMRARPLHWRRVKALVERVTARDAVATLEASGLAARAVEDELLYALALALDVPSDNHTNRGGRPTVSRRVVVDRALSWIAAHDAGPLHVSDLSRAAGVSERTLRNVFVEYFGIGPLSYVRMRQLHQVHAALSMADPRRTTVTSVATECGVWDLEVMAARYRRIFNETPVMTLRKAHRRGTSPPTSSVSPLAAVR